MKLTDYEEGKKLEQTHICTCGGKLTLCWGGFYGINSYVLRCANKNDHSEIMRPMDLGPYDIPGFNLYNLKRRHQEMVEKLGEEKAKQLQPYEQVAALTKNQAMKILQTIWPDAPTVEVLKAAIICRQYGLNPLMKHIFLMPFNKYNKKTGEVIRVDWATHIGIKANRLIARRVARYSYTDNTPRVMTKQEQETIFGAVDTANLWAITKLRDSGGNEAQGYGSWPKAQPVYGADRGNSAANMAFIHSERNALDRLFPGEMPQDVGIIDEQYIETDYKVLQDIHPDKKTPLISPPGGKNGVDKSPKAARTQSTKKADNKVGESAQRRPGPHAGQGGAKDNAAAPSGADEHTLVSASDNEIAANAREATADRAGFISDLPWVYESLDFIHWSIGTARSWITSQFKIPDVSNDREFDILLSHLNSDQAKQFTDQLRVELDKRQKFL